MIAVYRVWRAASPLWSGTEVYQETSSEDKIGGIGIPPIPIASECPERRFRQ